MFNSPLAKYYVPLCFPFSQLTTIVDFPKACLLGKEKQTTVWSKLAMEKLP